MDDSRKSSKVSDISRGFGYSPVMNYGGPSSNHIPRADNLDLDFFGGFLDGINELDDIYATEDLSTACEGFLLDNLPELDCCPLETSSDGLSPGLSRSSSNLVGSQFEVNHGEEEKPLERVMQYHQKRKITACKSELGNDTYGGSTSQAPYDFRPRRGRAEKHQLKLEPESEDEFSASEVEHEGRKIQKSKSSGDRRKNQRMWTLSEVMKLVDGIARFGVGKWTDIKRLHFSSVEYRTPVDLRDKWRNLLKASSSHEEYRKYSSPKAEERPKSGVRPMPNQLVHRILELAAIYPYPNKKDGSKSSRCEHGPDFPRRLMSPGDPLVPGGRV